MLKPKGNNQIVIQLPTTLSYNESNIISLPQMPETLFVKSPGEASTLATTISLNRESRLSPATTQSINSVRGTAGNFTLSNSPKDSQFLTV